MVVDFVARSSENHALASEMKRISARGERYVKASCKKLSGHDYICAGSPVLCRGCLLQGALCDWTLDRRRPKAPRHVRLPRLEATNKTREPGLREVYAMKKRS